MGKEVGRVGKAGKEPSKVIRQREWLSLVPKGTLN